MIAGRFRLLHFRRRPGFLNKARTCTYPASLALIAKHDQPLTVTSEANMARILISAGRWIMHLNRIGN
jgi:hypothetical protein